MRLLDFLATAYYTVTNKSVVNTTKVQLYERIFTNIKKIPTL